MGEVRRVHDEDLGRVVAMKILKAGLEVHPEAAERMREEARINAQLQHPGVVPVHEVGRLPDGRLYFTMKEVVGRTLRDVTEEVYRELRAGKKPVTSGWTFRGLVEAFHKVCEAVAFAHSRGVVHRDIKPANVMVGEFGEVYVMDWGIARVLGRAGEPGSGGVTGTPTYMSPEQAAGSDGAGDARTDVYALGAVLYTLLAGIPPYRKRPDRSVVEQVLAGPPVSVAQARIVEEGPPPELVDACERAMRRDPTERHPDALALARDISAWLAGARRREQALAGVVAALRTRQEAERLRREAGLARKEARGLLAGVAPGAPEAAKAAGWAAEDRAAEHDQRALSLEIRSEQDLQSALRIDPALPEAHAALAERYHAEHRDAEADRDEPRAARAEAALRVHAAALPIGSRLARKMSAWLEGSAELSVDTDPSGADVALYRFVRSGRRLIPRFERSLGRTPLVRERLPMGSYLCVLTRQGAEEVRYPVVIGRGAPWNASAPDEIAPRPIRLPPAGSLGPEDCYVPAGWYLSGGDPHAIPSLPRRSRWVEGFVMRRFPVTNREYLSFLQDLADRGSGEEAMRWVPRYRAVASGERGVPIYGRDAQGRFFLQPDEEGDVWDPEHPVVMVDAACAEAYAGWLAEKTGSPWRLPSQWEWEKAARGVDGRFFPWGDTFDPSYACVNASHEGAPHPSVIGGFPVDESVYGVRGMTGNTRDWTGSAWTEGGEEGDPAIGRVQLGGSWRLDAAKARAAVRTWFEPAYRSDLLGFRIVRSL